MIIHKIKEATLPKLQSETLHQLTQLKIFVDAHIRTVSSKNFENDEQKIKYLIDVLHDIRDFVLTQTVENSVRINLIQQFETIENEIKVGNENAPQESKFLKKTEEKLEQDQQNLKTSVEEKIESTPNS